MVRDDGDAIMLPFEPSMLLSAATSPGSLVPSIKFVALSKANGQNPLGHDFADNQQQLIETVAVWLAEQKL